MNKSSIGGTKKRTANILAMAILVIVFIAYMFPFLMVVINSLKEKRISSRVRFRGSLR